MATSPSELRWRQPCSWVRLNAAWPGVGAEALAVVAFIQPRKAPQKDVDRGRILTKLRCGSLVYLDPVLTGWLRAAITPGWYAAHRGGVSGPLRTPEEGQAWVMEALGVGQAQEVAHG